MNNQYHVEGDFLIRKRGSLGSFDPNEVVRRFHELTDFHHKVGNKRKHSVFRRIAHEFDIKVGTVIWSYMIAKEGYAGKHINIQN